MSAKISAFTSELLQRTLKVPAMPLWFAHRLIISTSGTTIATTQLCKQIGLILIRNFEKIYTLPLDFHHEQTLVQYIDFSHRHFLFFPVQCIRLDSI